MNKQDFFELLLKYESGKCSDVEKKMLYDFYEQFQSQDNITSWSNTELEQSRLSVLRKINATINRSTPKKSWKKQLAVAATIISLISLGSFFYQSVYNYVFIPENAITLELEDGTVRVIEQQDVAKLFYLDGRTIGKQTANGLFYTPENTAKKMVYNTLKVPYGKNFKLGLSDGTMVHINSGSEIKFPIQFIKGMNRTVFVTGEAYFDVAKNKKQPFIVCADNLNIRVLGTKFNVNAYPEDDSEEIVLVEGSVALYNKNSYYNSLKCTMLKPGFQAKHSKKTNQTKVENVITAVYTSWMNGELVFRNMSFENIAKKLERHYNVEILIKNKELSSQTFNASFGQESLLKVLESLKENYGITYKQENNKIIIY